MEGPDGEDRTPSNVLRLMVMEAQAGRAPIESQPAQSTQPAQPQNVDPVERVRDIS